MTAESAKNILWNPDLYRHQDYDFVIRYARQYKFAVKTEPTVIYILAKPIDSKMHFKSCMKVIVFSAKDTNDQRADCLL
jgi:hypothetical protein